MFIEVQKLIEVFKTDHSGNKIPMVGRPGTKVKYMTKGYEVKEETIRLDEIKSCRPWEKNPQQEQMIDDELTLIYLKGDSKKETTAQMLIKESHKDFSTRLGSTKIK